MLVCETCGHIFDEDEALCEVEYTGVTSEGWSEKFNITRCPKCGDDMVTDAVRCDFCGKWSSDNVCGDCKDLISVYLNKLAEQGMTLHRANGVRVNRLDVLSAISEVLEDL